MLVALVGLATGPAKATKASLAPFEGLEADEVSLARLYTGWKAA